MAVAASNYRLPQRVLTFVAGALIIHLKMAEIDSGFEFELSLGLKLDSATSIHSNECNVKKLSDIYGVDLEEEIKLCPDLLPILTDLSNEILPVSGLTIEIANKMNDAKNQLELAKRMYFQQQIVYRTFLDSGMEANFSKKGQLAWDTEAQQNIEKIIAKLEIGQFFKESAESNCLHLGLKSESILLEEIDSPTLCRTILPALEKKIAEKFEKIMNFYGTCKLSSSEFTTTIESNKISLMKGNRTLEMLQQEYRNGIIIYYKELKEAVEAINELLNKISIELHVSFAEKTTEELVNKLKLLQSKAKILYQRILVNTYTAENVKALQVVKSTFVKEEKNVEYQTLEINNKLREYANLGENFKRLVQEIKYLNSEIATHNWTIAELKK